MLIFHGRQYELAVAISLVVPIISSAKETIRGSVVSRRPWACLRGGNQSFAESALPRVAAAERQLLNI